MSNHLVQMNFADEVSESIVELDCANGPFTAIHHQANNADTTVVFMPGRPQTRVGPHRLFVFLARQLALQGINAVRFDHSGWGDNLGPLQDYQQPSEELASVLNWIKKQSPANQILLLGLCDGATASLLEGHADISGLILLNPFFDDEAAWSGALVQDHYLSQTKSAQAIWGHIKQPLQLPGKLLGFVSHLRQSRSGQAGTSATKAIKELQTSKLPIMLCFAENDLTATQSQLQLKDWLNKPQQTVKLETVRNADHTFSNSANRQHLLALITEFVNAQVLTIKN